MQSAKSGSTWGRWRWVSVLSNITDFKARSKSCTKAVAIHLWWNVCCSCCYCCCFVSLEVMMVMFKPTISPRLATLSFFQKLLTSRFQVNSDQLAILLLNLNISILNWEIDNNSFIHSFIHSFICIEISSTLSNIIHYLWDKGGRDLLHDGRYRSNWRFYCHCWGESIVY